MCVCVCGGGVGGWEEREVRGQIMISSCTTTVDPPNF